MRPDEEFPSTRPFNSPGKFSLSIEHDGHGSLFILNVSDLLVADRCEQVLRLIMTAVGIDPEALRGSNNVTSDSGE